MNHRVWGIIPAAGMGSRIQPLAFSKELLPAGSQCDAGIERPRAVSEYLIDRMVRAGADRLCFVISRGKSDILEYYGGQAGGAAVTYVVQPQPRGLCDAIFQAIPLITPDDHVLVGLPDTIWFPEEGLTQLDGAGLSFLLFPVTRPEFFDSVVTDDQGRVQEIQVKQAGATSRWIWGAFKLTGQVMHQLHELWLVRQPRDEYLGTLVNAWIAAGGRASAVRAGTTYIDVGTLDGYRQAIQMLTPLSGRTEASGSSSHLAQERS